MSGQSSHSIVQDDGFVVEGFLASDVACYGMAGNRRQFTNPSTTVCVNNQVFFLVDKQDDWNWGADATDNRRVDAVCGLGYEQPSADAVGWLARAANQNLIKRNAYSITLVP